MCCITAIMVKQMINSEAIEQLMWLWSLFDIKFLSILAAAFTIYFGVQKYQKGDSVVFSKCK